MVLAFPHGKVFFAVCSLTEQKSENTVKFLLNC